MRLIHHRTRYSYWSHSKLSVWIRKKFGLTNPKWATMDEWDDHEDFCKSTSPIIHWITDKGFNKLQDIWLFIPDLIYTIKVADIWKYFRNLYIFHKALWRYRSWDYSGLLMFMEAATKDMHKCHKNHGHLMRSEETAKELLIVSTLLKRIRQANWTEDKLDFVQTRGKSLFGGWEHIQKPNTLPNYKHPKTFYAIQRSVEKHDVQLLAKIFERKVRSWWD